MATLWYCLAAFLAVGYVVLDGYDLGAGALHLAIARTDEQRRAVLASIGPLWDGNEVWLVALGGTILFAFPRLYAAAFSGFYLPLMMVLWLLIGRGMSVPFRSQVADPVWRQFWDVVFAFSSGLLVVAFGAALGNVLRGVTLDSGGGFFLPLWTDFSASSPVGALDWYTVLVGLFALAAVAQHGALWVALRTGGDLRARACRAARIAWLLVLVVGAAATIATFRIQPRLQANLAQWPWGMVFPALALGALIAARMLSARGRDGAAFLASSAVLAGMLGSAAFGIYPYVLPALADPAGGLTAGAALAGPAGLAVGLRWWIPGMALALVYVTYVHRKFSGPVNASAIGADKH